MKKMLNIVVLSVLSLLLTACSSSPTSKNTATISSLQAANSSLKKENDSLKGVTSESSSADKNSTSVDQSSAKAYGLNEKAEIIDSDNTPIVSLTLTSATKSFSDWGQTLRDEDMGSITISNEKTVQFTVAYTNLNDSENYLPSIYDFAVYDSSGTAATIVDQQDGQTEVSKGHTASTTFWANFNNNTPKGSKIELEYQLDDMDSPITFDLTVN